LNYLNGRILATAQSEADVTVDLASICNLSAGQVNYNFIDGTHFTNAFCTNMMTCINTNTGFVRLLPTGSYPNQYTATNTLTVISTGLTNNTADTYLVSATLVTGGAVKDQNGTTFLAPVAGSVFYLKPGFQFTGTAITATAVIINR
jgi:hypothetical protein